MFENVSNAEIESKSQSSDTNASLFDAAYNAISSPLSALKETVFEHPEASAAIGLIGGAALLYLTRGRLWGRVAQAESTLFRLPQAGEIISLATDSERAASDVILQSILKAGRRDLYGPVRTIRIPYTETLHGESAALRSSIEMAAKGEVPFALGRGKVADPLARKLTDIVRESTRRLG